LASADSLIAPGESLYTHGDFKRATESWSELLTRPGIPGSPTEAKALTWLGLSAYRQGDYAEARRLGERALTLKRELAVPAADLAESQNALGLLAWNEGRLQDAVGLLREALNGFSGANDRWGVAKTANNLALVELEFGRFAEARKGFETGRTAAREIRNQRVEGRATTNLAMIEAWTGDPQKALDLLADARRLVDAAGDPVGQESALGQLAVVWVTLGELGRAVAVLDTAISIARRHGLRQEEANDLAVAASIYGAAGDMERAIRLYEQSRSIDDALGLTIEAGTVLRLEAALRSDRKAWIEARINLDQALRLHRGAGARLEEFHDLIALTQLEAGAGEPKAAIRWLSQASKIAAELEAPQTRVALATAKAEAALAAGQPDAALAALGSITRDLDATGTGAVIEVEWLRTRAFAAVRQLDSAAAAGRRSVAAIERAAQSFRSPVLGTGVTTERSKVFADLVLVLLELGHTEEAFSVADAARGRALLDHLASTRDAGKNPMGRDLAERQRLLRAIAAIQVRLAEVQTRPRDERGPDDEIATRELSDRLREARAEYEGVLIRLAEAEPARAGLGGARVASLQEVRSALRPDEVLLQYFVTTERLVIFAVNQAGLTVRSVPVSALELENRIRLARELIAKPEREPASYPVLEELHRILIGPIAELSGVAPRIVIVPHDVLTYLPFAALRAPRSGRYLVEEYSLRYLPTAAAQPALQAKLSGTTEPNDLVVFAPLPERLPASRAEAFAIGRILPESRRVVGSAGTEAAFRKVLTEGQTAHIATHGNLNSWNPMFSSLTLAWGNGSPGDDGRLEVHELLDLTVLSPLVFLSGCETALGGARQTRFDRGQDYTTLAQAFLYAGAKGVVATLWRINDEGAAAYAERFYNHLTREPPVAAVAAAQRDLLRNPRWRHPYYWAAYTVIGVGARVSPQSAFGRPSH
jgi:CHAT domain-containing protein